MHSTAVPMPKVTVRASSPEAAWAGSAPTARSPATTTANDDVNPTTGWSLVEAKVTQLKTEISGLDVEKASVEQQVGRTARDRNRPLLRTANPEETLRNLLALRDPLYREIADLVVETDERPPRMVVLDILERLQKLPPR